MKRAAWLAPALLAACVPVTPPGTAPRPPATRPSARYQPPPPVLLPTASATDLLDRDCPTFATALRAAGLTSLLAGPVTVLVPTEEAWRRLAPGILADLLRPENRPSLVALLRFHIVPGRLTAAELRRRAAAGPVRVPTLAGEPMTVTLGGNALLFTDATGHRAYLTDEPPVAAGAVLELNGLLVPQTLGPQS